MWPDRQTAFEIGPKRVGPGAALFVIAEIGLNHGGSVDRALEMVDAAADAGASAVKLQTLIASELVAPGCPPPVHVNASSLVDFFARFELDEAAHAAVVARARSRGLAVLSTPLSLGAVDMLERVGVDAYKIASGDLTWSTLVRRAAVTGRPVVLSTGMSAMGEIAHAVGEARLAGASALALMHCVSSYPVSSGTENLRAIATLAASFEVPVGLSDHAPDAFAVAPAVVLGASLYERHIVLDGDTQAVDAAVSSTPAGLADIVRVAARCAAALGTGAKQCGPEEAANLRASRRGLYAARALAAGAILAESDLVALRPLGEIGAERLPEVVGARLARAIPAGAALAEGDFAGGAEKGRGRAVA